MPVRVLINGKEINDFSGKEISVRELPADMVIYYEK
jgi:hypothetical protein